MLAILILLFFLKMSVLSATTAAQTTANTKYFRKIERKGGSLLPEEMISSHTVDSESSCSFKCLQETKCVGFNYKAISKNVHDGENCQISNRTRDGHLETAGECKDWEFYQELGTLSIQNKGSVGSNSVDTNDIGNITSCKELYEKVPNLSNGYHATLQAYCDLSNKGWTLLARFSNNDFKHWMSNGSFWYDRETSYGEVDNPSHFTDMISPAFWRVKGEEFKITRSDDSSHTALLRTIFGCLQGVSFRSKITGYGNFRNASTVWASNECRGRCEVVYSGLYNITAGFGKHNCDSDLQNSSYIGFWCHWKTGDGAVMMIGGGGDHCDRADHGIGITEENSASFGGNLLHHDFGDIYNFTSNAPTSYSLNLWVR